MGDRHLQFLARLVRGFPAPIVILALMLAVASAIYASLQLHLNANTDDLIGPDLPFYEDYRAYLDEFGDLEYIYIVVVDKGQPQRTQACVDTIARGIAELGLLPEVHSFVSTEEQLRIATRAMTDEQLDGFVDASKAFPALLSDGGTREALDTSAELLDELVRGIATLPPDEQRALGASAIFLLESILGHHVEPGSGILVPPKRYVTSETGKLYFLAVVPVKDYGTLGLIEEPLRRIREVIDTVRIEFSGMEIGMTGRPVLQADEMMTTSRDMMRASIVALILISFMFMIMMGSVWRPALAVLSLMCGLAWTFGLATLILGQLNLLSIVFTLVLVGIGIDFGVHLLARYAEERALHSASNAVTFAMLTAGRGNVTGAITSSLAFFMAVFTDFQGLRELGLIAGSGLLLCLVAMLVVLPSLLVLFDRKAPLGMKLKTAPVESADTWEPWLRRPKYVLAVAGMVTLVLIPAMLAVGFQENLLELQAGDLESIAWEQRISEDSVAATWFGAVIVDSMEDIPPFLIRADEQPAIGDARSILDLVQTPTDLRRNAQARLRGIDLEAPRNETRADWDSSHLRRVLSPLSGLSDLAANTRPEDAEQLRGLYQEISRLAMALNGDDGERVRADVDRNVARSGGAVRFMLEGNAVTLRQALPRSVQQMYMSEKGRFLVLLHPNENVWDFEHLRAFVTEMRTIDPEVTGAPIASYESLAAMKHSFVVAAFYALIAVTVLVLLDFRSVGHTLLAMAPLVIGIVWTIELMGLLGIQFNLANFFAVPILIGIGVDNGVHMLHRYREHGGRHLGLGSTRRAVILTTLTTAIGFGCLATASHRGLQSLGVVMVLGSISCLVATIVLLPAGLAILVDRHIISSEADEAVEVPDEDEPVRGDRAA